MRKLTTMERRLLVVLGTAAILFVNLMLLRWISAQIDSTRAARVAVAAEIEGYRALAEDRPYWEARQAWLETNQPATHAGPATDSAFAEQMQNEIRQFNLTIETQQLLEPERMGEWIGTPLDLTLRGNLESIVRWLQSTQSPGKFVAVRSFNLRQSDDGKNMILRIRLQQLYMSPRQEGDAS